ncbi:MAG: UDP-glucose/GDP-mannose dehydrogenase family protein [Deltaproteobacteria bacterium]|nr:UDP-glucose/GDP-mannose dehydrogenase family protein [Deltaproteobacteria bacterium]
MNICVIGTGYVGLVTGVCFAEFGLSVGCVDKDEEKIENLKKGKVPIYEPGLEELVVKNLKEGRLTFSTDLTDGVRKALVVFIAVGTPSKDDGSADLSYVEEVARTIGANMNGYKVIVTKSTVPTGTGKLIEKMIKENQDEAYPFDVVSNPEFLREGSAIEDFMRPNRVVIGSNNSPQAVAILKDLYSPLYLIEAPFVITNVETAEMVKYASNAFLATKVSFINEMANLCEKVGADVHVVAKGMGLDHRIGSKFLHPGPGFGGSCFPKDTTALARLTREKGLRFEIVEATIAVNDRQRILMIEKIKDATGGVKDKKIAIWGLTFKPNTDDLRDAPSLDIIKGLLEDGAKVRVFDPAGLDGARKIFDNKVEYADDMYKAVEGCDALVVITEWNQFRSPDFERLKGLLKTPVVIDLRNVYEPEKMRGLGFKYTCVGR